jgi:DNA-binding transcriptional ArsR family regulator
VSAGVVAGIGTVLGTTAVTGARVEAVPPQPSSSMANQRRATLRRGIVTPIPLGSAAPLTRLRYNRTVVHMQVQLDPDRIFGALADATRRDIVRRAIEGNEGVAELAGYYPMSFAAVQKHVAILERAGLVTKQRMGRRKVVRTNLDGLHSARRLLDQYEELWRGRIERMTELVTESTEHSEEGHR